MYEYLLEYLVAHCPVIASSVISYFFAVYVVSTQMSFTLYRFVGVLLVSDSS